MTLLPSETNNNLRTYLNEFDYRTLSYDTTAELIKKYKTGDRKAYDFLVKGYLRLVVTIAKRYMHRGLELEDLIQEGTIGLFKAFDHFNYDANLGFSKYASWWIMQSITQALFTLSNIVQLPLNVLTLHRKVWKFVERFEQEHEYLPSVDDIDFYETSDLELLKYIYQLPADIKEQTCLIADFDIYESPSSQTDYFQETEYNSYFINRQLHRLGNRNEKILRKYFGIEGNQEGESLNAIGDYFGLTRERVRQIVEKSIRQLRDISSIKREEAKIGDYIRLTFHEQVGEVISIKKNIDNSSTLVLKMDAGNTKEVLANASSYEILQKKSVKSKQEPKNSPIALHTKKKKQLELNKKIQKETNVQRIANTTNDVKVGDRLKFNGKECIIQKILTRGGSSRFLVEYSNGVFDYVPNDESKYRIVRTPLMPLYESSKETENESEPKCKVPKEAAVGDRIVYNSTSCIVIDKRKRDNVIRLKVKYDDGRIDNVLGEPGRYEIVYQHDNCDKKKYPQSDLLREIVKDVVTSKHSEKISLQTKSRADLYEYYSKLIMNLNQAVVHGRRILAKPALLVAIIDSINEHKIQYNQLFLYKWLEDKYNMILSQYVNPNTQLTNIAMPFWHLQSDKFWHLKCDTILKRRNSSPTKSWLIEHVKYAFFDDDLWFLLQDEVWRNKLRNFVIDQKMLDSSVFSNNSVQLENTNILLQSEIVTHPKFFLSTSLSDLVLYGIITNRQLKHCYKKGLRTIGDVKHKIEYYHLTPDSTRFTKYTLDMWFGIVDLLNNNV